MGESNVEFTNVYQRNIKIYNGIDNTLEFDIKNSDQKRLDLSTLQQIQVNIMDASGNALPSSPYQVTPTLIKGIGKITIPSNDVISLSAQYLIYSVTAIKNGQDVLLYSDTKFGATGIIELIGNAIPTTRNNTTFNTFTAEIDLQGTPIHHTSAIPVKFYEAIPTSNISLEIHVTGFNGTIWVDATTTDTISIDSFKKAGKPFGSWTSDGLFSGIIPYGANLPVNDYSYFRVSYQTNTISGHGASFNVIRNNESYDITLINSGTNYSNGSLIKILGSHLGGVNDINDVIITVTGVNGTGSSYTVGSITSITWTGIATTGNGAYNVTGMNYSGIVDKIIVI